METVLIILAIVWVVIPILAKSKQKQAAEQAERERLARQRAAQAPLQAERARSVAQPVRTAPLTPNVGTSRPSFAPSFEGVGSLEGRDGAVFEGEEAHEVATTLKTAQSSLTQLNVSADHEVTPSSVSGHAHEETSMSGIDSSCPPDQAPTVQVSAALSSADSAFVWDPANARSGLVLAEILGPCLAMRE
jgi:hypothetical protein